MRIFYTSVKYKLYYFRGEHIDKQYFLYTKRIHYTQIGFLILIFSNSNKNACYCGFDENAVTENLSHFHLMLIGA